MRTIEQMGGPMLGHELLFPKESPTNVSKIYLSSCV